MEKIDEQEVWKDIPGYEGLYRASSLGRFMKFKKGKWKINHINTYPNRYKCKTLIKDGAVRTYAAHRLIAMAFHPNPENKSTVNHKDLNKGNNKADNLEWATQAENMQHAANNYPLEILDSSYNTLGYKSRKQLSHQGEVIIFDEIYPSQCTAMRAVRPKL